MSDPAEKIEPNKPLERFVHKESFYKTSLSRRIEYTVVERQFRTINVLSLTIDAKDDDFRFAAVDYFSGIVAKRLDEGWAIQSMTTDNAVLIREPVAVVTENPDGTSLVSYEKTWLKAGRTIEWDESGGADFKPDLMSGRVLGFSKLSADAPESVVVLVDGVALRRGTRFITDYGTECNPISA